ncbi:hypothetical protein [Helicobacter pylori]|nr:hypothetical protein [Helicobacter pylori]
MRELENKNAELLRDRERLFTKNRKLVAERDFLNYQLNALQKQVQALE